MYSNLFINIKKIDHNLSYREKMLLNFLLTQAIINVNDHITQVPFGLHEQSILDEDLLHHHIAFTSEIDHDMLENLKEAINAGFHSILESCGIQDFNIHYYLTN